MPARAWGARHLSEAERVHKILEAGCDQLGGESRPELVVQLVQNGALEESRLDVSVRRLLREKFVLGLFDNPFVDVNAALAAVGKEQFVREGVDAQKRSLTLLTNKEGLLPLRQSSRRVYIEGIDPDTARAKGFNIVSQPGAADLAILRLKAPYEPRPGGFENKFHSGSLEFSSDEKSRQSAIFKAVPTIIDIHLDRPAIVPEVVQAAAATFVSYGTSPEAFLDVLLGDGAPEGKLPFDLPSSMQAVAQSRSDVPYDTENPVFRFGHGLLYKVY
jgi:beta-glucosidase-like glycosyl hydrolase